MAVFYSKLCLILCWSILLSSCRDAVISDRKSGNEIEYNSGVEEKSNVKNPKQNIVKEKNDEVPDYVFEILTYIRTHDNAPANYVGGKMFYNREKRLPVTDESSRRINYKEWDVHPKVKGQNRGPERLVTSIDKAYYTKDHYKTFILIKEIY